MNNGKKQKPKKRWKQVLRRVLLTLAVLMVLAGAGLYALDRLKQEYTVTYDAYTASTGSISNSLSFSGSLQLIDDITYAAGSDATVRTVYVQERDDVQKGDKLLRLSNGETVTADFDGRINQLYVQEGDEISADASLVQLADFTHMTVSLRVDEYDISKVQVGTACQIVTTASQTQFDSSIAAINYISSSGGNVAYYTATAYVDVGEGIYPGMQVTVTIPQEEAKDVVVLKADALSFTDSNSAFVYVEDEAGEMQEQAVEVGVSNGNYVEIKSGLQAGDTVYAVAEQTQTESGLSGLLSGLFGNTQKNAMPMGDFPGGDFSMTPPGGGGDRQMTERMPSSGMPSRN